MPQILFRTTTEPAAGASICACTILVHCRKFVPRVWQMTFRNDWLAIASRASQARCLDCRFAIGMDLIEMGAGFFLLVPRRFQLSTPENRKKNFQVRGRTLGTVITQ
jgi:hypothetical protein